MSENFLKRSSSFTRKNAAILVKTEKAVAPCLQQDGLILIE